MGSIAAIIVNYGTADLALSAVESVLDADIGEHQLHVHLVDNASPGDDAQKIADVIAKNGWENRVTFYPESENHGFGRGNNLVLDKLAAQANPPDRILFVNPDSTVQPQTILQLSEFLDKHPRAAAVGPRIVSPETDQPVTAAFRFPSIASEFASAIQFGPVSRLFRKRAVPMGAELPTTRVDWVAGALFLARFDALRDVGFYEPAYFLYYEEVDMMRKLYAAGWEIWHLSEATALHIAGVATDQHGEKRRGRRAQPGYWYDSWRIYWLRNHSFLAARICAVAKLAGWMLNVAIARIRGQEPTAPMSFARDFSRHVLVPMFNPTGGKADR